MELATIIISSLALVALVIVIVLLLTKKEKKVDDTAEAVRQERILASVDNLKENIPNLVKQSVTEQLANINKEVGEVGIRNQKTLAEFQEKIDKKLDEKIESLNKKVDTNLSEIKDQVNKSLVDGFKGNGESMAQLQKALGEMNAAQENIKALSGEVVSLKAVLNNNQGRGRFGEIQLEMLLAAMFGESNKGLLYDVQYKLTGELKPDAVVFMDGEPNGDAILCIDSKFAINGYDTLIDGSRDLSDDEKTSLKKDFQNALKTQINQVARYVIAGKTVNTALMFIPNDGIFAFVENEFPELVDYARSKSVVMTCPTIIQPLIAAFKVIQNDAKKNKNLLKINDALAGLSDEFKRFGARWDSLQKTISTLGNKTNEFGKTVTKLDRKFSKISGGVIDQIDMEEETAYIEEIE